jgi:hypothetical protein
VSRDHRTTIHKPSTDVSEVGPILNKIRSRVRTGKTPGYYSGGSPQDACSNRLLLGQRERSGVLHDASPRYHQHCT